MNAKKLVVLGHARSGTTILGRLFNSSENVLLLGEAHLFESYWNTQFVTNFNAHHQRTKKVKSKGTRLPSQFAGMLPEAVLLKLGEHYQWDSDWPDELTRRDLTNYHLTPGQCETVRARAIELRAQGCTMQEVIENLSLTFPRADVTPIVAGWWPIDSTAQPG